MPQVGVVGIIIIPMKTTTLRVDLPVDIVVKLREKARLEDVTVEQFVAEIIGHAIEHQESRCLVEEVQKLRVDLAVSVHALLVRAGKENVNSARSWVNENLVSI